MGGKFADLKQFLKNNAFEFKSEHHKVVCSPNNAVGRKFAWDLNK